MAALCCAIDRQCTVYRRVPSEMGNGPYTMRHKSVLRNSARRRPATLVDYFAGWLADSSSLHVDLGHVVTRLLSDSHCNSASLRLQSDAPGTESMVGSTHAHAHTHNTFHFAHDRWNAHPFTTASLPAQRTSINRCKIRYVRHTNLNPDHVSSA